MLRRTVDHIKAVDGISVRVREGRTVGVVGESGSGKTTLLRMFNRTVRPDAGEVRVEGRSVAGQDPVALRRRIGYVPQNGGLIPHWPVGDNVELVPRLLGWPAGRRRRRAVEMLALVGLDPEEVSSRYPRRLSGGQRQRVALARALVGDPGMVLLDDATAAVDPALEEQILATLAELPTTVVMVTHRVAAMAAADRVAFVEDGAVRAIGTHAELQGEPGYARLVAAYEFEALDA